MAIVVNVRQEGFIAIDETDPILKERSGVTLTANEAEQVRDQLLLARPLEPDVIAAMAERAGYQIVPRGNGLSDKVVIPNGMLLDLRSRADANEGAVDDNIRLAREDRAPSGSAHSGDRVSGMGGDGGVLCFPPHQYFGGLEIRLSDLRSLAAGVSKVWFPSEAGIVAVDLKKTETKENAE